MDLNTSVKDIPDLVDSLIELPSDDENTLLLKNMIFWKLQLVNKDQVLIRETEFWRQVNLKESSFASNLKREFSSMLISIVKVWVNFTMSRNCTFMKQVDFGQSFFKMHRGFFYCEIGKYN
jgi:hypothetical protein